MEWERNRFGYAWYVTIGDDEFAVAETDSGWDAIWFSAGDLVAGTAYDTVDQAKDALEAMACDNLPH